MIAIQYLISAFFFLSLNEFSFHRPPTGGFPDGQISVVVTGIVTAAVVILWRGTAVALFFTGSAEFFFRTAAATLLLPRDS